MATPDIHLFALKSSQPMGEDVAQECGIPLSSHEERHFEDGEHKIRPLVSVRGADVYVLHSLYDDTAESVNDKLCRLLFFIGALRDAGARRITAITPYLCYARKDRRTQPRDPLTMRYVALLFEAVGVDRVVTVDVHNLAAYQNAFRCRTEHLEAGKLIATHVLTVAADEPLMVVSPDVGGVKRVDRLRDILAARTGRSVDTAFVEKRRSEGVVSGDRLFGAVVDRVVILLDDLVSTGTTLVRAARACREAGALQVHAAATHGLFVGKASSVLADRAIDTLITTDSIPPFRLEGTSVSARHTVLRLAPLLGEAIRRLHADESLVALAEDP